MLYQVPGTDYRCAADWLKAKSEPPPAATVFFVVAALRASAKLRCEVKTITMYTNLGTTTTANDPSMYFMYADERGREYDIIPIAHCKHANPFPPCSLFLQYLLPPPLNNDRYRWFYVISVG